MMMAAGLEGLVGSWRGGPGEKRLSFAAEKESKIGRDARAPSHCIVSGHPGMRLAWSRGGLEMEEAFERLRLTRMAVVDLGILCHCRRELARGQKFWKFQRLTRVSALSKLGLAAKLQSHVRSCDRRFWLLLFRRVKSGSVSGVGWGPLPARIRRFSPLPTAQNLESPRRPRLSSSQRRNSPGPLHRSEISPRLSCSIWIITTLRGA